jgi:hypothetical protein
VRRHRHGRERRGPLAGEEAQRQQRQRRVAEEEAAGREGVQRLRVALQQHAVQRPQRRRRQEDEEHGAEVIGAALEAVGHHDADAAEADDHAEEPPRDQRLEAEEARHEHREERARGGDDRRGAARDRPLREVHAGVAEAVGDAREQERPVHTGPARHRPGAPPRERQARHQQRRQQEPEAGAPQRGVAGQAEANRVPGGGPAGAEDQEANKHHNC